jgi:peptidoglycan/LPS O-acetylase OafA/YrhL
VNTMNRLPGLDLLRAIAIVWVMLFHSYIVGGLGDRFDWLGNFGWMGVDLFFVLSGYLIGSQLLKPLSRGMPVSFADFYVRRAFRILPVLAVVLLLYFCWPSFREAPGIQPFWQFPTFTVNFLIDYEHNKAFSHVWSLCVEEHFYLVFPVLAWWLMRRPSTTKFVAACLLVVIGGMTIRGYVWLHDLAPVRDLDDGRFGLRFVEGIYYPTYSRLDGLLAGVMLATIKTFRPEIWSRLQTRANTACLAGLVVVGLAIWLFQDRSGFWPSVVGYPLLSCGLAFLVFAAAGTNSGRGRARMPMASWLALISYSLYLTHKAVFHLVQISIAPQLEGHGFVLFGVYAIAVIAVGSLMYCIVEQPFLRLRDRLGRSSPAVATAASPA